MGTIDGLWGPPHVLGDRKSRGPWGPRSPFSSSSGVISGVPDEVRPPGDNEGSSLGRSSVDTPMGSASRSKRSGSTRSSGNSSR